MSFDNLKNVWENMAKEYASRNSAYENELEAQAQLNVHDDALTDLSLVRDEKYNQLMQIPIIDHSSLFEIDNNEFLDDAGLMPNPTYGQSVMVENPLPPTLRFETAATPANMWSNPIMFSVIAERALLGLKPIQPLPGNEFQGSKLAARVMNSTTTTQFYTVGDYTHPGPIDNWTNDKATGFTLNQQYMSPSKFTGIAGESPNMTFSGNTNFYSNTDYGNWPGPMNVFGDDKATGFTLNQTHQSPTRFAGAGEHSTEPYMEWTNDIELGGSIFGISIEPQTINYMSDEKSIGFSPNLAHKSPSDIVGIDTATNIWTPTTNYGDYYYGAENTFGTLWDGHHGRSLHEISIVSGSHISGFDKNFNTSIYSEDNPFGSSKYSGLIEGDSPNATVLSGRLESMYTGLQADGTYPGQNTVDFDSTNTYSALSSLIPIASGSTNAWDPMPDGFTYSGNTIHSTHPDPTFGLGETTFGTGYAVDFFEVGRNSTIPAHSIFSVGTGSLSGFDVNFKTKGSGFGNSKYGTMIDGDNVLAGTLENMYTGLGTDGKYNGAGITPDVTTFTDAGYSALSTLIPFGETGSASTWTNPETYYDSIHTFNPITTDFGTEVDFMFGMSLHEASLASSGSISGFTSYGNYSTTPSYTGQAPSIPSSGAGNSELLGLWNQTGYENQVLTSLWTGMDVQSTGQDLSAVTFDTTNTYSALSSLIPSGVTGSTDTWNITGNYYDGIHSGHPTPTSIFGTGGSLAGSYPGNYIVNFMSGKSLNEFSLANSASISGFTKYSMPYNKGTGDGNSELLDLWDTEWAAGGLLTSLWTGYNEDYNTVNFTGTWSPTNDIPTGETGSDAAWTNAGNYYDGIHTSLPNPTTNFGIGGSLTGTEPGNYTVDFMHNNNATGFDINESALSSGSFMNIDNDNAVWDTATTSYRDIVHPLNWPNTSGNDQPTYDFATQISSPISTGSLAGGYTAESPLGTSAFLSRGEDGVVTGINPTNTHEVFSYGNEFGGEGGFSSNLQFDETDLFDFDNITLRTGQEVGRSKGSHKGGQPSNQFNILYNIDGTAKDGFKYTGDAIDGSIVSGLDKFNISGDSSLWTVDHNRVYTGTTEHGIFSKIVSGNLKGLFQGPLGEALNLGTGTEPYVTFDIGDEQQRWTDVYLPISRLQLDVQRIGKFLGSQAGEKFIVNQELLGTFQLYKSIYDPGSTMLNVASPGEGLGVPMLNFSRDTGVAGKILDIFVPTTYTEWLDTRAGGGLQAIGAAVQSFGATLMAGDTYAEQDVAHKPLAFSAVDAVGSLIKAGVGALTGLSDAGANEAAGIGKSNSKIDSKLNMLNAMSTTTPLGKYGKGDIMTLQGFVKDPGIQLKEHTHGAADATDGSNNDIGSFVSSVASMAGMDVGGIRELDLEASKEGMPFYFTDLRDGMRLYFRAYIDGISDSISPNWTGTNYIGRSEPVYTYTNAEREIGFNLKLFAQTKDELNMIYVKLNKLTSLCYPQYKTPEVSTWEDIDGKEQKSDIFTTGKTRMKPPLTKLRIGELFGSAGKEMSGFIKSLTHTFPDESPWEIKYGQRVPKYITVDITYQVIHSNVPSLAFAQSADETFYGINQTGLGVGPGVKKSEAKQEGFKAVQT